MPYQREDRHDADIKNYWKRIRYAYDVNGDLEYKGRHKEFDAATDDINYSIVKYSYDVNGDLEDKQIAVGSWTGRAALGW